jgi:hypothetical protein
MRERPVTREAVELDLLVELSRETWVDVTEDCGDPDAVECLAVGWTGQRLGATVFLLVRYEDEGEPLILVVMNEARGLEARVVTREQFKLEWLWEEVTT